MRKVRWWWVALAVVVLGIVLYVYRQHSIPGDEQTDEQSETLAVAIAYPHQTSADGFARAVLNTQLGRQSNFAVLEAVDLPHRGPREPMARLVWRIHVAASDPKILFSSSTPAFDACYEVEFNFYEATSGPSRIDCPTAARPYNPSPEPLRHIPPEFEPALRTVLDELPAQPSAAEVRAAVAAGLPPGETPPTVLVDVEGTDVAVVLGARLDRYTYDCLAARRVDGRTELLPKETEPDLVLAPCSVDQLLTR